MQTTKDRRAYTRFRRNLQYGGFRCFQYSVYIRDCPTHEVADRYTRAIKRIAPAKGHISILRVTEAQMLNIVNLYSHEQPKKYKPAPSRQLILL